LVQDSAPGLFGEVVGLRGQTADNGWRRTVREGNAVPFWVYLLLCADDSFYVGHTDNLEARIAEHHAGARGGFTLSRRPVTVVFTEEFPSRDEALVRERQIKGWSRAKKKALCRGDWDEIRRLASDRSSFDKLRTNG
jgi:predicted GIY-YIG superfamily endonuclease